MQLARGGVDRLATLRHEVERVSKRHVAAQTRGEEHWVAISIQHLHRIDAEPVALPAGGDAAQLDVARALQADAAVGRREALDDRRAVDKHLDAAGAGDVGRELAGRDRAQVDAAGGGARQRAGREQAAGVRDRARRGGQRERAGRLDEQVGQRDIAAVLAGGEVHLAAERLDEAADVARDAAGAVGAGEHVGDVASDDLALQFDVIAGIDGDLADLPVGRGERAADGGITRGGDDDLVLCRVCDGCVVGLDVDRRGEGETATGGDGDPRHGGHAGRGGERIFGGACRLRTGHEEIATGGDVDRAGGRCGIAGRHQAGERHVAAGVDDEGAVGLERVAAEGRDRDRRLIEKHANRLDDRPLLGDRLRHPAGRRHLLLHRHLRVGEREDRHLGEQVVAVTRPLEAKREPGVLDGVRLRRPVELVVVEGFGGGALKEITHNERKSQTDVYPRGSSAHDRHVVGNFGCI